MRAIQTTTFLYEWLDRLAHARNMSVMALAVELRTPRQLIEEVGRFIAHAGIDDALHLWSLRGTPNPPEPPAAPTADTSLRGRVAYATYQRLKDDEMKRLNAEAESQLSQYSEDDAA